MKVLIIHTGGTIGSSVKNNYISVDTTPDIVKYASEKYKDINFHTISPYKILSEYLNSKHINTILDQVDANIKQFDGIIITHGSDTIHYTAAALALCIKTEIPIMVVCAAKPPADPHSNAYDNFDLAVKYIISKKHKGVFVPYKNDGENTAKIHDPLTLLPHQGFSADLHSDGTSNINKVEFYNKRLCEEDNVLIVCSYPDCVYPQLDKKIKSVILIPYHSGTLCCDGKFKKFCDDATCLGIRIYTLARNGTQYESVKEFSNLGIECINGVSLSALYIMLKLK